MSLFEFRRIADEKLSGKWSEAALVQFFYSLLVGFVTSIGGIGMFLIGGPINIGYAMFIADLYRGERPNIGTLVKGFDERVGDRILLGLISQLYLLLWSMLFLIPGIIKSFSYSMIYFIQLDNPDMHYEDIIMRSRKIMNGNKWRLFCLYLSHIVWYILVFLTFGVLSFWVAPKVNLAKYAMYLEIKNNY